MGCIFGSPVIFLYNFIKEEKTNKHKEKNTSKKTSINIMKIMGFVFILFGIVSLLAYYGNVNIENKIERSSSYNRHNFSAR